MGLCSGNISDSQAFWKGKVIKLAQTEPFGMRDISFYNLLVFKIQQSEDFPKLLSKPFCSTLKQILVKYSVI